LLRAQKLTSMLSIDYLFAEVEPDKISEKLIGKMFPRVKLMIIFR